MTSLPNTYLENLKTNIKNLNVFAYVDYYPDKASLIGKRFPAVMIQDGDHSDYALMPGHLVQFRYEFTLWLYHNIFPERIPTLNTYTDKLIQTVLENQGLDPAVFNLETVGVYKGDIRSEAVNYYKPGIYGNLSIRRLDFSVTMQDSRN
ncbi:MAG: hypothetical protein K8S56_02405 [Candidatus Cloacimonetes bacterium]|nr:hypothetical protein [Candidatus Cloacimonadota bacterium]